MHLRRSGHRSSVRGLGGLLALVSVSCLHGLHVVPPVSRDQRCFQPLSISIRRRQTFTIAPARLRACYNGAARGGRPAALLIDPGSAIAIVQASAVAAFHWYEVAALRTPIVTKAATSGVAYLLGDLLAQRIAGPKIAPGRVARSTIAGFVSHGPTLHYWCLLLDRFVNIGTGIWAQRLAVVLKILLDQTIFSLYLNAAYCALTEALKRTRPSVIWARVRSSSWPMLRSSWRFWPAVHAFTFSIVPQHLRVLWVDAVEVVWVAILATLVAAAGGVGEPTAEPRDAEASASSQSTSPDR